MGIDVSQQAAALGITTEFVDLRPGQAAFLPQQIVIIGQGRSDFTYSTDRRQIFGDGDVASEEGGGSQLHNAAKVIYSGSGPGSIPVFVCPLPATTSGGAAATGAIAVSGTATRIGVRKVRAGGVESAKFAIAAGAANATARYQAIKTACDSVLNFPLFVNHTYGTVGPSVAGVGNAGDGTCATFTTTGGPKAGTWVITCTTAASGAGTFRVVDPDGLVAGYVEVTGAAVSAGGLGFTLTDGAADFEVGDSFTIPVPSTGLAVVAKSHGTAGNYIELEILTEIDDEAVFTLTQPTGGAINPTVTAALGNIGSLWGTVLVNCLEPEDSDALDAIDVEGETRWGTLNHKPFVAFTGTGKVVFADITEPAVGRELERNNAVQSVPGSPSMPCIIAASAARNVAFTANNDPAMEFIGLELVGVVPGLDSEQFDIVNRPTRDAVLKAGITTSSKRGEKAYMEDVVTFYRDPTKSPPPYQFVTHIIRDQNGIYNLWLKFVDPKWATAPFIADNEATTNRNARKKRDVLAAAGQVIDGLCDAAIWTNREEIKATMTLTIPAPRRWNLVVRSIHSTNAAVRDVTHEWGFWYPAS
jgi:phage tail sheath gpL-like